MTADEHDPDQLLRPKEAYALLGVSRTWLHRATEEGRVPAVHVGPGGPRRYRRSDLLALLTPAGKRD